MKCSDYQGGLKLDFLTVEALDRIRKDMELLVEDKIFEWQGSLKKTYDKYIHPDVLDLEDKEMWDNLCQGKILDAFQMDSPVGKSSIAKVQPYSFYQVCDTNALMRISCEGKQPIDRYNDNKKDIDNWYKEMKGAGLTQDEEKYIEDVFRRNVIDRELDKSEFMFEYYDELFPDDVTGKYRYFKNCAEVL